VAVSGNVLTKHEKTRAVAAPGLPGATRTPPCGRTAPKADRASAAHTFGGAGRVRVPLAGNSAGARRPPRDRVAETRRVATGERLIPESGGR
jgi:hypothetical protein